MNRLLNIVKNNRLIAFVVAYVLFISLYLVLRTSAAPGTINIELEEQTLSSNAQVISDAQAAGNSAVQFTSGQNNDPKPPSVGRTKIPVYDTAWEAPVAMTLSEADEYFRKLSENGFTGSWMSYFNHVYGGLGAGNKISGSPVGNPSKLNDQYAADFRKVLDIADKYDQKVGIVAIWAVKFVCDGTVNSGNSQTLGRQFAEKFGDHPAVAHWVMGGDNFDCFNAGAHKHIWANLVKGLREGGATQKIGWHTPPRPEFYDDFKDESWVDFIAAETGHCVDAGGTKSRLQQAVNGNSKPVWAGEMRYENIRPTFCGGPPPPSGANEVLADVKAAVEAGVEAIVYGHNERWQWGKSLNGGSGRGGSAAVGSVGAAGEKLMMEFLAP